tara:strand:+ start:40 stop:411 length:372 start_codon:yes stop_codon:yes gene_type:complete
VDITVIPGTNLSESSPTSLKANPRTAIKTIPPDARHIDDSIPFLMLIIINNVIIPLLEKGVHFMLSKEEFIDICRRNNIPEDPEYLTILERHANVTIESAKLLDDFRLDHESPAFLYRDFDKG